MEIAVAANSPLGQYLAELDADNAGVSAAQLLETRPKRPRRRVLQVSRRWSCKRFFALLRRRAELLAVRRLIPQLCDFHQTIREEVQQEMTRSDAEVLKVLWINYRGGQWKRRVVLLELLSWEGVGAADEVRRFVTVAAVAVAVAAMMITAGKKGGEVFALHVVGCVIAVVAFALLGLELVVRLLFAWHALRSGRLVVSLKEFVTALEKLNEVYGDSLTLVKRAELASRGYRLGTGLLPPIGRLEASNPENNVNDGSAESAAELAAKQQLRCLPLRRRLWKLNDELLVRASVFEQNGDKKANMNFRDTTEKDTVDGHAPSLLLTALAKQRNRAVLLLESAVHTVLVRNMAHACSSCGEAGNLFRWVGSQRVGVDDLVDALRRWTDELKAWNTTSDPVSLLTSISEAKSSERQQSEQQTAPSDGDNPHLKSISTHLQELRSTSETLSALVIAAQHELLPVDSMEGRLSSSREAMKSMVQQVQEAWSNYDNALGDLTVGENIFQRSDSDDVENHNEIESKLNSHTVSSASVPTTEDPNCTVVFSGTSTGDEGFDLQALLNQQDPDAASSAATPHFVRELRDVLAHRQGQAQPGLTKQVDHDPPMPLPVQVKVVNEAPPPPPPADTIFALPRAPPHTRPRRAPPASSTSSLRESSEIPGPVANTFNLELQALLQRSQSAQQQDAVEYLGDSDEGDEDELLPSPSSIN